MACDSVLFEDFVFNYEFCIENDYRLEEKPFNSLTMKSLNDFNLRCIDINFLNKIEHIYFIYLLYIFVRITAMNKLLNYFYLLHLI